MVDKAEQLLLDLGFHQVIEVMPCEFEKILQNRNEITEKFKNYGFLYVTMDLQGYRTGSMNETI